MIDSLYTPIEFKQRVMSMYSLKPLHSGLSGFFPVELGPGKAWDATFNSPAMYDGKTGKIKGSTGVLS
jgi:hypothetical protein